MSLILPYLFVGGKDEAKDLSLLQRLGIRHVINVTPPRASGVSGGVPNYHEHTERGRLTYKRFELLDSASQQFDGVIGPIVSAIEDARWHGNVFVHCFQGVSRSPAVVAAYLIKTYGLTVSGAITLLRRSRPCVRPNSSFMHHLDAWAMWVASERERGALKAPEPLLHASLPLAVRSDADAPPVAGVGFKRPRQRMAADAALPTPSRRPPMSFGCVAVAVAADSLKPYSSACAEASGAESDSHCSTSSYCSLSAAAPVQAGASACATAPSTSVGNDAAGDDAVCQECALRAAAVHCSACAVSYCSTCDQDTHAVAAVGQHTGLRHAIP